MTEAAPLASYEVRWFFEGSARSELKHWFEGPWFGDGESLPLEWRGRLDDQPDRYLVVPGAAGLGLKWREGELQVKGRAADLGIQVFADRHSGRLEHWLKWSYGGLPAAYRDVFDGGVEELATAAVAKTRAMRKYRLDTFSGEMEEVPVDTCIDRGLSVELTEIEFSAEHWCSLGFEAFPDDAAMPGHFLAAVGEILTTLDELTLAAADSLSYPAWLSARDG